MIATPRAPSKSTTVDYAHCNSFQHAFLNNLSKDNSQAFDDLFKYWFRATYSGETISTIHRNLVTEHFNKKNKKRLNPIN